MFAFFKKGENLFFCAFELNWLHDEYLAILISTRYHTNMTLICTQ